MLKETIAFIGAGTMGQAVLSGLLESNIVRPEQCICTSRSESSQAALRKLYGTATTITTDNCEAARRADIIVLGYFPFLSLMGSNQLKINMVASNRT